MDKKAIQEQRMKGYFIEATKNILKGEGLKSLSVRNIADDAGYSYATLYNYFNNIKDLIYECVKDFLEECEEFVSSEIQSIPVGVRRIKAISAAYMKYFVQYPGIFELFFLEETTDLANKTIYTFLDNLCEPDWNYCIQNKLINPEEAEIKKDQMKYVVLGILSFYLTRRNPATYDEFRKISDIQLNRILDIK